MLFAIFTTLFQWLHGIEREELAFANASHSIFLAVVTSGMLIEWPLTPPESSSLDSDHKCEFKHLSCASRQNVRLSHISTDFGWRVSLQWKVFTECGRAWATSSFRVSQAEQQPWSAAY